MRLPWLQVDQSAFARAEELAAILDIGAAQALGHLVMVWRWAIELGPEDEDPTGELEGRAAIIRLEAGAGWKGERGVFFAALVDLDLAEGGPEHVRVRGCSRYAGSIGRKEERREKARKAANARWGNRKSPAENAQSMPGDARSMLDACSTDARSMRSDAQAVLGDAKTQTQTQTHIDLPDGRSLPLPPQGGPSESLGQLAEAWNEITSPPLPRVEQMPPDRKKRAKAALQRRPLAEWRAVFAAVEASGFCRGEDGGWKASFDWAIRPGGVKPEPAVGLLEGVYARIGPGQARDVRKGVVRAEDALARMEPAGEVLL